MAKDRTTTTTVSDAVHKLQLALLEGIEDENHLFSAGSLMSRSDYEDVVTERSLSKICGYPLCRNSLPSERPRKGHYRISLKEHKVYDLHETYMYCCSSCLINSRAFGGSLQDERCSVLNPAKVNEILSLFENVLLECDEEMGNNGDLGLSKLRIQEKSEVKGGEVSLEDWVGPSNAIEGYVPQRDRISGMLSSETTKKGAEPSNAKSSKHNDGVQKGADFEVAVMTNGDTNDFGKILNKDKGLGSDLSMKSKPLLGEMDFMSCIITDDEYTVSKKANDSAKPVQSNVSKEGSKPKRSVSKLKKSGSEGKDSIFSGVEFTSTIITEDEYSVSKLPSNQVLSAPNEMPRKVLEKPGVGDAEKQFKFLEESSGLAENHPQNVMEPAEIGTKSIANENGGLSDASLDRQNGASSSAVHVEDKLHPEQAVQSSKKKVKSSLRTSGIRKLARSVTWADEKNNALGGKNGNLCDVREFKNTKEDSGTLGSKEAVDSDDSQRLALAEACAMALSEAAEAVASGQSDVTDAVSEAGIILLPQPQEENEGEHPVEDDALDNDSAPTKWPKKPGNLDSDLFDSEDSWFDAPPEGFSLTLSPFATMWNALFSRMTSSSLAYIYGRDESFHEEYMFINGREYPRKTVLPDGRSSEIKQTLAGCLARALPGVIANLKLPTPVSTLEQGLACLLDTMSFMDALPSFRVKQWQVTVLLFIDALSICRIPGLTPHFTSRRVLIPKVLNGSQISSEEYEIMKDLVIPLGRVPQYSMQSGG